jgi:2-dehydro-3-deoxyphosphogluconate aldolase/(4S)-4-hydroxy-2-oxoglutarate aldolase
MTAYRFENVQAMLAQRLIGVVRTTDAESALAACHAMLRAGMTSIEVTLTNRHALQVIEQVTGEYPSAIVGAGTVLDEAAATLAVRAGARFLVSPGLHRGVLRAAARYGVATLPGIGSVTELQHALEWGADAVKLFPASAFAPGWIRDVRAALPHAPIVPTGGVTTQNIPDWLAAGAVACAVGSSITSGPPADVAIRIRAVLEAAGAR